VAKVTVQADVTATGSGQFAALVARYSGPGDQNMYMGALVDTGSDFEVQLWRNVGGTWTRLGVHVVGSGSGHLSLVVSGTTLTLFFGGTQELNLSDSLLSGAGSVGMRASAGATLDNFSATSP
jgi:hypothetical protein